MRKGYVYIFSNKAYKDILKVGRTSLLPEARAKAMSRHEGVLSEFEPRWHKEVPDIVLAEYMLHFVLKPYAVKKEYFRLPLKDAINICEEALKRVFKQLKTVTRDAEKFRLLALENEAILLQDKLITPDSSSEEKTGIATIPVGESETTWEDVIASLRYSFGKEAIKLCLKENKSGDPLRKRFISFRAKYMEMQRVDLYFYKNHLMVYVVSQHPIKSKRLIREEFGEKYRELEFVKWQQGFSFKIRTDQQFRRLKDFLQMGSTKRAFKVIGNSLY